MNLDMTARWLASRPYMRNLLGWPIPAWLNISKINYL